MKTYLLFFKLCVLAGLLLWGAVAYSQTTKTTYDFSTAAALSGGAGGFGYWNTQADISIGGVAYRLTCGGNGSFTNASAGGASGSKCLRKDGSGGDTFTLQRADGKPFQFYGLWVNHQSMNMYSTLEGMKLPPWYTLTASAFTYPDNTPMTAGTNWDNYTYSTQSISAGTEGVTTTSVGIYFQAIIYFAIDNIVVGPTPLTATTSQKNVSCNGSSTGSATVTASGGSTPYSYAWLPTGGSEATASDLKSGTYTCTITEAGNSTLTKSITITQPAALALTKSHTNAAFNGASNGSATVSAAGGKAPYSYAWLPTGGTAATAGNLKAGTYTVTATDANKCTATETITVTEPAAIRATTDEAGNLTSTSATLHGTINSDGVSANATFEYGTGLSYGTIVNADQNPIGDTEPTAVSYALTNLTPNTTYHFRVVAVNAGGTAVGEDKTFTVSTSTDALNVKDQVALRVYPNPVTDRLQIETNGNQLPALKLYNLQGELLHASKGCTVDLSVYASGAYVLEVEGTRMIVMKK